MTFLLNLEKKYQRLAHRFKILPHSPLSKIGISKLVDKHRLNELTQLVSDPDIKKAVKFYNDHHHKDLYDTETVYNIMFLCQCIKQTENLQSDIIELGTYKGGSVIMMAWFLKQINSNRKIFACDTFEGVPDHDDFVKDKKGKGMCSDTSFDFVLRQVEKFQMTDKIELVKGRFQDLLDKKFNDSKFSLVFMDCQIYSSAKFGIEFTFPRLVNDGIMVFQNYGIKKGASVNDDGHLVDSQWGETIAVEDFLTDKIEDVRIDSMPYLQKGKKNPTLINKIPKNEFSKYCKPEGI